MEATLIYPHQLFAAHPAITTNRRIYLIEESLLLTHNPAHRARLLLHKLSLDAYQHHLAQAGHAVVRLTIAEHPTTESVLKRVREDGVATIHVVDTTDNYLEHALTESGFTRVWYESPLFLLPKAEASERYQCSKRFMANFYKALRRDRNILMDGEVPQGGRWSFDDENRQKLPKGHVPPPDIHHYGNADTSDAVAWVTELAGEQYGAAVCWLPYTHAGAEEFLQEFLRARLATFGPYEDALTTTHVRLYHSTLSPLLNIGLLTPEQVLTATLEYATEHSVPINSLEGFVRQLLGWREFIRASYEVDGGTMRTKNFFKHTRPLPRGMWDATTGLLPVDHVINTALTHGYTHHIERLMVAGNYLLLCQSDPDAVYRWFMGMYIDAYDWVMVPNVYGMSQFADGGSFATKPYISGANYLRKMSDYPKGDWEATWTALYWHFIAVHQDYFARNHRLSMMPRLLEKQSAETRAEHQARAQTHLAGT